MKKAEPLLLRRDPAIYDLRSPKMQLRQKSKSGGLILLQIDVFRASAQYCLKIDETTITAKVVPIV